MIIYFDNHITHILAMIKFASSSEYYIGKIDSFKNIHIICTYIICNMLSSQNSRFEYHFT